MKTKAAKILDILFARRTAFKAVLLFVMAVSTIQWVHYHFAFIYRGFLVWGALIIAWDYFHGKKLWEGKTLNLLMAFCMFYAVTIFLNRETELVKNLKALAYMVILFITLYGGGKTDPEESKRERKILVTELFTLFLIIAVVCLALFLMGYHKTYKTPDKVIGYIGSFNKRLAGLMNSNTIGAFFSISVLLDLGLLFGKKDNRTWKKVLIWISLTLSALCLFLSYSRTSLYALAFALALGVFWLMPRRVRAFDTASYKTVMTARVTAALCLILLLTEVAAPMHDLLYKLEGVFAVQTSAEKKSGSSDAEASGAWTAARLGADENAPYAFEGSQDGAKTVSALPGPLTAAGLKAEAKETPEGIKTAAKETSASAEAAESEGASSVPETTKKGNGTAVDPLDGHPDGEVDAALTGRLTIWKTALVLFKESPLFGVTNCGFADTMWQMLYGTGYGVHVRNGGLHNIYLEVLLSSGTVGAVCIGLFGIVCLVMVLVRRKVWIRQAAPATVVLLLLIVFFLIAETMESRIMYRTGFFMVFFWMAAGMLKEDMMGIEIQQKEDAKRKKRLLSSTRF